MSEQQTDLRLYLGGGQPDVALPSIYLQVAPVRWDHKLADETCSRCSKGWDEHAWILFLPSTLEVDCSVDHRPWPV
jgi:hypothetical protein